MTKKHDHKADSEKDPERGERISRLTSALFLHLGIAQQYSIQVSFVDEMDLSDVYLPDTAPRFVTARSQDDYPYRVIAIELARPYVDVASDYDLLRTILHEVLHIVPMAPLSRYGTALLGKNTTEDLWWTCLEEETVDLVSLWISRLWVDLEAATTSAAPSRGKQDN